MEEQEEEEEVEEEEEEARPSLSVKYIQELEGDRKR